MLAPDAPFPTTAAPSPGTFRETFEECFAEGAEAIVCPTIGTKLSATFQSATLAAQALPDREIHVIDTGSTSMSTGIPALMAAEMAAAGTPAAEIAASIRARLPDIDLFVAVDTLDYLRKGGRLSPARAAIGTVLSVKPIITVTDGIVVMAEKPRTRAKARERVIELIAAGPDRAARDPAHADEPARGGRGVSRPAAGPDPRRGGPGLRLDRPDRRLDRPAPRAGPHGRCLPAPSLTRTGAGAAGPRPVSCARAWAAGSPRHPRAAAQAGRSARMARVAIVTDSASDLTGAVAAERGIRVVPLYVSFGDAEFQAGVDLSTDEFWARMLAPDAPFPTTAAASPGDFQAAFEAEFAAGAEAIVCVTVGSKLSATLKSAQLAAKALPEREIHLVDSSSASMGVGLLVLQAADLAAAGLPAAEVASTVRARVTDVDLYVALDTIEYLRKGGRISPARAAIATVLSIKPIITVVDGVVETADKVRTRTKARARVIELLTAMPVERIAFLHSQAPDLDGFRAEVLARLPGGIDPRHVSTEVVGPSVGPHVGPGCVGAVVLLRR